jgi:hypothetical protein
MLVLWVMCDYLASTLQYMVFCIVWLDSGIP